MKIDKSNQVRKHSILEPDESSPNAILQQAIKFKNGNEQVKSIEFFKRAIANDPNNSDFWHEYILTLITFKMYQGAIEVLEQAKGLGLHRFDVEGLKKQIYNSEANEHSWTKLSRAQLDEIQELYNDADKKKLEQRCKVLLRHHPDSPLLYNILATSIQHTATTIETKNAFEKAIALKPDFTEALNNYGVALENFGELDAALLVLHKAIKIDPSYSNAFYNLGNVLKKVGRLNKSYEAYKLAIDINPDHTVAMNNLGVLLLNNGRVPDAIEYFKLAIDKNPSYYDAYYNLGIAYTKAVYFELAIEAYRKALSFNKRDPLLFNNLGNALQNIGFMSNAREMYENALELDPNYADAWNNFGTILKDLGLTKKANSAFEKAIELKSDFAQAHRHLSMTTKYTYKDPHFIRLRELVNSDIITEPNKYHIHFALAKAYEDIKDFDQAFNHLSLGNNLRNSFIAYNIQEDRNLFQKLSKTAPEILKLNKFSLSISEQIPIFVVGMPRSGTTLVEQILCSHPEIDGAGELNYIAQEGTLISTGKQKLNQVSINKIREKYFERLKYRRHNAQFCVDKMPHNFRFLPLIVKTFPEAKIIHVTRLPSATCWSNFRQCFSTNQLGYCYNLENITEFFKLYRQLMNLWKSILGNKVVELNYEALVSDSKRCTKDLLQNLNITWSDSCLEPHKNLRSVSTASQEQVRKKIYKGSDTFWKNYEPFLNDTLLKSFLELDEIFYRDITIK